MRLKSWQKWQVRHLKIQHYSIRGAYFSKNQAKSPFNRQSRSIFYAFTVLPDSNNNKNKNSLIETLFKEQNKANEAEKRRTFQAKQNAIRNANKGGGNSGNNKPITFTHGNDKWQYSPKSKYDIYSKIRTIYNKLNNEIYAYAGNDKALQAQTVDIYPDQFTARTLNDADYHTIMETLLDAAEAAESMNSPIKDKYLKAAQDIKTILNRYYQSSSSGEDEQPAPQQQTPTPQPDEETTEIDLLD